VSNIDPADYSITSKLAQANEEHIYVRSFVRSCVRAFVRAFVRSCVRSCIRAFVRSFFLFIRFILSFILSFPSLMSFFPTNRFIRCFYFTQNILQMYHIESSYNMQNKKKQKQKKTSLLSTKANLIRHQHSISSCNTRSCINTSLN
jgi:hypothetical protein